MSKPKTEISKIHSDGIVKPLSKCCNDTVYAKMKPNKFGMEGALIDFFFCGNCFKHLNETTLEPIDG